ncbi:MAG: ABC-2 family transporter protein [Peptostreptococcaceae bacterium]|nr:ABC-2 family transporter protein [Peptostreptococcaceae bacterium]
MKINKAVFNLKKSEFTIYRSNIYMNFLFGCVPIVVYLFLWRSIYGNDLIALGGYSYRQMITYFVLVSLLYEVLDARANIVKLSEMIEDGSIHNHMLKPIGFFSLNFKLYRAEKIIYLTSVLVPYVILCLVLREHIHWELDHIPFFIISLCLAFVLKYFMGCILGLLTTWIEEISGLLDLWNNIERFLSGGLIPLSILPKKVFMFLSFLPFQYMLFVPVDIYMGNMDLLEIYRALFIQIGWCIILGGLLLIIKQKAFRKYSGYGS